MVGGVIMTIQQGHSAGKGVGRSGRSVIECAGGGYQVIYRKCEAVRARRREHLACTAADRARVDTGPRTLTQLTAAHSFFGGVDSISILISPARRRSSPLKITHVKKIIIIDVVRS